jgi:hypothetical protein
MRRLGQAITWLHIESIRWFALGARTGQGTGLDPTRPSRHVQACT